ncbi:MAG: leucine-rich repeat protein, partial [Bacteroidales bacterium]|nr:leucine-rich repeat protein [Bacteroidales bacterium]
EFADISALPANPTHEGLTAQGWNMPSNWTLADAKTYISTNKKADWGQMYTTTSGKTEIDVELTDPNRMSPYMSLAVNGEVSIDWGDGSSTETVTGTSLTTRKEVGPHTYPAVGKYTIKVTASTGNSWGFYGTSSYLLLYINSITNQNRVYTNCIKAVRIGAGCTSVDSCAFFYCTALANITIPSSVTNIGASAFYGCYSLTSVTIPSSVTSISNYAFYYCTALANITIPSSVTSIGSSAFYSCYSLTSIMIPSSVTSISNGAFFYCYAIASVTIPSSVTSIGSSAFSSSLSLASVTVPSSVTSIATKAFQNCYGLGSIHFKGSTPPTVDASDAFTNLPTDCKIYVPTGYLTAYTTASNYPDSNTYTYIEE